MDQQTQALYAALYGEEKVLSRDDLRRRGFGGRAVADAVASGEIIRLRRGYYCAPSLDSEVQEAVRIGGRVTCLTLLRLLGVFVYRVTCLHVHVPPSASRIRRPAQNSTIVHWGLWSQQECPRHAVPLIDAVGQSVRCQSPRAAIATLDSVLNLGLMTMLQLREIFAELPVRFHPLLKLIDGSAGSGAETFLRLILRAMGVSYQTQVRLPGVGIVDFIVDGWLIIECDSKQFHQGWDKQVDDRRRDLAAARRGYVTVRPLARDIFDDPAGVRESLAAVIAVLGPRFTAFAAHNS